MTQTDEIVFQARSAAAVAVLAVLLGAGAIWILSQSHGLSPVSGGAIGLVVLLICVGSWKAARRRLVFAGTTAKLMSGPQTVQAVDLARVTRLVKRRKPVGKVDYVWYVAVFPDREIELFERNNFRDLPKIEQLLRERSGRAIEEERA
jgi:hypothetical protein